MIRNGTSPETGATDLRARAEVERDPLRGKSDPDTFWTTTSIGEATPTALTPLGATLWVSVLERAVRGSLHSIGALNRRELSVPERAEDRAVGVFQGRLAARVDFFMLMGDRLPGTSGAAAVEAHFGSMPPELVSKAAHRYYPVVAVKLPATWQRVPDRQRRARADTDKWARSELGRIASADGDEAHQCLIAAGARLEQNLFLQSLTTLAIIQPLYDQLSRLAATTGGGAKIMAGYGQHEETRLIADLWECSRDRLDIDVVAARYGYHGPREGEVSSVVWREDRAPLLEIVDGYRALREDANPQAAERACAAERQQAEKELLASLSPARRVWARTVLHLAQRFVPLRGVAKVGYLQSLDVVRASARQLGARLAADGVLEDPSDIFFMTYDEVVGGRYEEAREFLEFRRNRSREYELLELPASWRGMPEAKPRPGLDGDTRVIEGVAASPGTVEGRVRLLRHPGAEHMEPGEILVADTTDPSWASVLFMASGLVTDLGCFVSHAAVVARELDVPCVVGTKIATSALHTGDLCRVDGTNGRVEILERAEAAPVAGGCS